MKDGAKWRGMLRHLLTAGGGVLVALGMMTEAEAAQGLQLAMAAAGAVSTLLGFIWSFKTKDKLVGNGDMT